MIQIPIPRERFALLARRTHRLGERPLLELLFELQDGAPLADALERYAALAPFGSLIAAHGGRDLKPARLVTRRRA